MAILVVVTQARQADSLVHWGYQLARARREGLVVLCPRKGNELECVEVPAEAPEEESVTAEVSAVREAAARAIAMGEEMDEQAPPPPEALPPVITFKTLTGPDLMVATRAEAEKVGATIQVIEGAWSKSGGEHELEAALYERPSIDTLAMRCLRFTDEGSSFTASRILVPAAGGEHAEVALRLGSELALRNGGKITACFVEPPGLPEAEAVGYKILRRAVKASGITGDHVQLSVVVDETVHAGIRQVVEAHDLILVGAERPGFIRKTFSNTVPGRLLTGPKATSVAVVRRAQPIAARLRYAVERWLDLTVPQMTRDERIDLFERLQTGSMWRFDFMALIALSTSIASLGLIQSSTAVVIGAMLVAPLMTPILGVGLALVQGNSVLFKTAAKAIALGFVLAAALAILVGLLSPVKALTPELLARGGPNLLDLGVAFVSGVAAAFAMSRPGLLAALPGVAIAAALVPPIATVGIAFSWGAFGVSGRSALLFGTNVVAIALGASLSFFAAGVRGGKATPKWTPYAWAGLMIATLVMAIPLGSYLYDQAQQSAQRTVSPKLRESLKGSLSDTYRLVQVSRTPDLESPGGALLQVYLQGPHPDLALAERLAKTARPYVDGPVRVRLIPVVEARAR